MNASSSILNDIYRNSSLRMQKIPLLAAKSEDSQFSQILKKQWKDCCSVSEEVRQSLIWNCQELPRLSEFSRMTAVASSNLITLTDHSSSHLAEIGIQDCTQSIARLTRILHQKGIPSAERKLAEKFLHLEENHVREMKKFL